MKKKIILKGWTSKTDFNNYYHYMTSCVHGEILMMICADKETSNCNKKVRIVIQEL